MNETAKEWLEKASGDYQTAQREFRVVDSPNYDAVCFHAQQSIEKLMKGILIHLCVVPPRTHNLAQLYDILHPKYPNIHCTIEDLRLLTNSSAAFRYPGESADQQDANCAMEACKRMRDKLLEAVGNEES